MSKPIRRILVVAAWLAFIASMAGAFLLIRWQSSPFRGLIASENVDMATHEVFARAVENPTSVKVYQGVPNAMSERAVEEVKLRTEDTFKSRGHSFYSTWIKPSEADAALLHSLASNVSGFEEWGGSKKCGAFHPDWLIRWFTPEDDVYELHLCFGCEEAKFYGEHYLLYCDIGPEACNVFKTVLSLYAPAGRRRDETEW